MRADAAIISHRLVNAEVRPNVALCLEKQYCRTLYKFYLCNFRLSSHYKSTFHLRSSWRRAMRPPSVAPNMRKSTECVGLEADFYCCPVPARRTNL
jgi:hypothetical protein